MRDKREKFVKLANQRVNRAIEQIRLIGNLSNKGAYEFSEDDVRKIMKALQKSLDSTKSRFSDNGGKAENTFALD